MQLGVGKVSGARQWWTAMSRLSVPKLKRAFRRKQVGGILYETVGEIIPTKRKEWGRNVILIELTVPTNYIDRAGMELCLTELGVGLLDPVNDNAPYLRLSHNAGQKCCARSAV